MQNKILPKGVHFGISSFFSGTESTKTINRTRLDFMKTYAQKDLKLFSDVLAKKKHWKSDGMKQSVNVSKF